MIRQALLSFAAGVFVTALVIAAPSARAACQGYCADHIVRDGCNLGYSGCDMHYDEHDQLQNVDCFYVGSDGCIIN